MSLTNTSKAFWYPTKWGSSQQSLDWNIIDNQDEVEKVNNTLTFWGLHVWDFIKCNSVQEKIFMIRI